MESQSAQKSDFKNKTYMYLSIQRPDLHRQKMDDRLTIFDSSGVAVQDCAVAKMVYHTLTAQLMKRTKRWS